MRNESARPGKRPLRALSAAEKMEAIQRVHEGESKASVARDIGVPESTLRGWCKSEHKIRGMARNSSTPDSEVHSPASSSGTNLAATTMAASTTHSSEDETGPAAKRAKIDHSMGTSIPMSYGVNENSENDARLITNHSLEYFNLFNNMMALNPDKTNELFHRLNLITSQNSPNNLSNNFVGIPTGLPHSSTVGLVENGLQYTKASNKISRHSGSATASTQKDSVAKTAARKSLPAAVETPASDVPLSLKKNHDHTVGTPRIETINNQNDISTNEAIRKYNRSLRDWISHQGHTVGQDLTPFNLSVSANEGASFWQYYKQFGFPETPTAARTATSGAKKSPSKTRALLDSVLYNNNNNENVKRSLIMGEADSRRDEEQSLSTDEAIEHGDKFFKWLDGCSDPAVTRLQIMQFKYLLDNLKSYRKKSTSPPLNYKQSRK